MNELKQIGLILESLFIVAKDGWYISGANAIDFIIQRRWYGLIKSTVLIRKNIILILGIYFIKQLSRREQMNSIYKIALITALTIFSGFAQMGNGKDHKDGMMGTQQSNQMMGNQMMSQNMMHDMSGMMGDMMGMMQQMNDMMQHNMKSMDHARMMDMSKMMGDMSENMKGMSGQMAKGKMNAKQMKKMQERMSKMHKQMESLSKNVPEETK